VIRTTIQVPANILGSHIRFPYRNYSPVPVEVQTKSCVSTCYRPDYFIEHTCRESVGFYRPVPGVLLHTVTGVSTCNRCRTDLYSLYRSVQEGACKEYVTVACVKQKQTELYRHVQLCAGEGL